MVNVLIVDAVAYSTRGEEPVEFAEVGAVIDTDEMMAELKEEQECLEALIQRSMEHARDIQEMNQELEKLEEDILTSEAEEGNASGVAQS